MDNTITRTALKIGVVALISATCLTPSVFGDLPEDSRSSVGRNSVTFPAEPDVLWVRPVDIDARDLFHGVGGRDGAPVLSSRFVVVKVPGADELIVDEEGSGRRWSLTSGSSARAEVAASRLVWAVGYQADQNYFAPRLRVVDGSSTRSMDNVRLKRRSANHMPLGLWPWQANPFGGTRELQGLKVLMAVISNGDLGDQNNRIARLVDVNQRVFFVGNLKATLGKTARTFVTSGNPRDYFDQKFIDKVQGGIVDFHNKGNNSRVLDGIRVEEAHWMGQLLGRLSNAQLQQVFRAGGFNETEVALYLTAIKKRITELNELR